jgi:hypothetical protein
MVYSSDTCFPFETVIGEAPFLVSPAVAQATERKRMVLQPQSAENIDGYLIGTSCEKWCVNRLERVAGRYER